MVLEPYGSPPAEKVQDFRSPFELKDLQDPDAEEEAFLRERPAKEEAVPPPVLKEAPRRPEASAAKQTRTAMAPTSHQKGGETRGPVSRDSLFSESETLGSFKSRPRGEPKKVQPAAPAAQGVYGSGQEADETEGGRRPGRAPTMAKRKSAIPSRVESSPRKTDSLQISEQEARRVPLERIRQLAAADRCEEARIWAYIYRARIPEEKETGQAWMEVARCFHRKGEDKDAEEAARQAMKIPSTESEAKDFLQSLPHPGPGPHPPD
jgi:hypothetical protein